MNNLLINKISSLFSEKVKVIITHHPQDMSILFPEERVFIQKSGRKRQQDFCGGRWCAHEAVKAWNVSPFPILQALKNIPTKIKGMPIWLGNWKGSISHSEGIWGAAVTEDKYIVSLGFDVEVWTRNAFLGSESLGCSYLLMNKILSEKEKKNLLLLPLEEQKKRLALLFSGKEALYKCLCSLVPMEKRFGYSDIMLNWKDVCISVVKNRLEVHININTSLLEKNERLYGQFFFWKKYIFTSFWVERVFDDKIEVLQ